ncbi:MAG: hypothetical protein A3G18_07150 [Rhodospirillales bacterium RIFCSPLOWO2_12_FULL_58_28]|nr:MAG: hypothetical protein A3H92_11735 [Rhodospirillales bacterium RIFCSPLOWO2_02_FULL_58_16]OHC78648.1 MAG: hypothetical protein A3G18_07150 [Rhodospirillales bacterium RIFCSPLOWO2_12_FULL_58_28]
MTFSRGRTIALGAVVLLASCSFSEEALWPSLSGEEPAGAQAQRGQQGQQGQQANTAFPEPEMPGAAPPQSSPVPETTGRSDAPPQLGTTNFEPAGVTPGAVTGTFVGKKVVELREELSRLQNSVSQHNAMLQQQRAKVVQDSQRYHGTVAAINARLQVGTTPGNPVLVQQFNSAQGDLDRINADTGTLNKLATAVSGDSTMSAFLAESTRAAFNVSGAVDEDHRQLAILEDEVNRTVVLVERLMKELADDIRRQTNYVATEHANLNLLSTGIKGGEIFGASLGNTAASAMAGGVGNLPPRGADTAGKRALVVIRFDRPNVPYQQALYNAVSRALESRPGAVFDLVAVAPDSGGPARVALNSTKSQRLAEGVLRSLVEMGLPPARVAVSGKTSGDAKSNEVHLYLR